MHDFIEIKNQVNNIKCLICKQTIKNVEIQYEDFYKLSRGNNTLHDYYVCFYCVSILKRGKGKND